MTLYETDPALNVAWFTFVINSAAVTVGVEEHEAMTAASGRAASPAKTRVRMAQIYLVASGGYPFWRDFTER
jgi:hypothetical protein